MEKVKGFPKGSFVFVYLHKYTALYLSNIYRNGKFLK